MANYLSTLGSDACALILCATDMTIAGEHFEAGQPFTYLKGVTVSIDTQNIVAQSASVSPTYKGLHLLDSVQYLDQLVLNNVPYSKKVQSLFFHKEGGNIYENVVWERLNAAKTKLKAVPTKVFLYVDGLKMTGGYSVVDNWVTIEHFNESSCYNICYSYADNELVAFQSKNYPYFKVVLYIKGNVANKTLDQTIVFEKVALIPQTALNFLPNAQNFVTLNFGIIDAEKTVRLKI